ncbi:MAG: PBP1A family penicillin-binding protein, partial [Zoogloea sp.]|nr:PBP1A family penicillin-binding protein [Zoogloea sp.]
MRWAYFPLAVLGGALLLGLAVLALVVALAWPTLPSLESLTDYRPKIPLQIYTADGHLIGEYGDEKRAFVHIQDVPAVMKNAILAAEDDRFYQHSGVDFVGVLRAAGANLVSGGKRQGASTITMQVARNFFLTREKTISRKLYEILLAYKIENNLNKDQILELYVNQIFLGRRAYGFAAASRIYFGKPLAELSIAEAAMLAGLPKAPSAYNPVVNPKRAQLRQQYVLRRMTELGFITEAQQRIAMAEPLHPVTGNTGDNMPGADYVAEMARQIAVDQFKDDTYTRGIKVITTIVYDEQAAAYRSLRKGVMDYDRRHGYRGAESYADMSGVSSDQDEALDELLADIPDYDDLKAAIVLEAGPQLVKAYRHGEVIRIGPEGLRFAASMLKDNASPSKRIRRGAVIRLVAAGHGWEISHLPEVEAGFVSADPVTGAVRALVGGFDFNHSKFNHVTQAWRQPGSSFKPFIYSAALEKGYSPSSVVEDSPLSFPAGETGSQAWEPKNYDGKYDGPIPLRTALAKSKNMVSIRLLRAIGAQYTQDYITRFGFDADKHPPYLTMALGAGSVTPWQMVRAYSVFANGGYRITPYVVKEMQDANGNVLAKVDPPVAGQTAERVIDARNAYLMDSMMKDVVRHGTAMKALSLGRGDLAGKTGTTNEYVDAWFCGYQPTVVGVA